MNEKLERLATKLNFQNSTRKKSHGKIKNDHLDYQKNLSFLYQEEQKWKSAINTKINKKINPEIYNETFPELNNLREWSQVDVHSICRFYDNKKSQKYLNPKTDDGYTKQPKLTLSTAVRCLNYMPDENRRENIKEIVKKYTKVLDEIADQKDIWKKIRHELTDRRQTKVMLKVLKNNLLFLNDPDALNIYKTREQVEYIARTVLRYSKE